MLLVAGPWTNEPAELRRWDAERFQEIADRAGDGWVDQPIEYPPGSVVVFDAIAGDDVVTTNRILVVVSALLEFGAAAALWRGLGPRVAKAFLVLGLPLVPMGLLRLDMLVTVLATVAALAVLAVGHQREPCPDTRRDRGHGAAPDSLCSSGIPRFLADGTFALLVMAGAMIKIWPALLVVAAVAIGRRTAAAAAIAATGVAGGVWLLMVGAGLGPVDQVLSLRGATGWHVESLPGTLISLFGDGDARLELNAFRIGTLNDSLVTAGRVIALAVIAALAIVGARARTAKPTTERFALVMIGAVAALVVTAPLLSPQFLLWLTPWAALLFFEHGNAEPAESAGHGGRNGAAVADHPSATPLVVAPLQPVVFLVATTLVLTGGVLTVFGPENLTDLVPTLLLTVRNFSLVALPFVCLRLLKSPSNGRGEPVASSEPR